MPKPVSPIKRIDSLYSKCLDLVEQEVEHLRRLAIAEKLSRDPAKDLRDIIKLLESMKDAHQGILDKRKAQKDASAKAVDETALLGAINVTTKASQED
jgi:hypothetical protein